MNLASIALNFSQAHHASLWQGLVAAYSPQFASGKVVYDLSISDRANGIPSNFNSTIFTAGKHGKAFKFTGTSNTHMDLGNPLKLAGLYPYSISAWVCPASFSNYQNICFRGLAFQSAEWGIIINGTAQWTGQVKVGSVFAGSLLIGKWSHLLYTYDGTIAAMYQDGKFIASYTTPNVSVSGAETNIGGDVSDGRYFDGLIGDWLFYNRVLTRFEIAKLARGSTPFMRHSACLLMTSQFSPRHQLAVVG